MRVPEGEAVRAAWPGAGRALLQGAPPWMTRSCLSGSSARRCPPVWGDGSAPAAPLPCAHTTDAQREAPAKEHMQGRSCYASSKAKCSIITAGTGPCCCGDWLHLSGPAACFGSAC